MKNSKNILLQLPIWILLAYLCATLLLYAFGPFDWETPQPVAFWLLQTAYLLALFAGWQLGLRRKECSQDWESLNWEALLLKWLPSLLLIYAVVEIINLFRMFGFAAPNFIGLAKRIFWGIQNPGESYNDYQSVLLTIDSSQILGGKVMTVINYLWELVAYAILLMSIYYFKKISNIGKILVIVNFALILCEFLSIGTNIGVFRLILAVLVFLILWFLRNFIQMSKQQKKRVLCMLIVLILLAIIGMIVLFDTIMKSRGGILFWDSPDYNVGGYGLNRDSFVFKILPEGLYMTAISASAYLCQGYQGMALALSVDWQPTFGVGHSMWATKMLKNFGIDVLPATYQGKLMAFGWDSDIRWHTIYTWWANDVGFIGTIFVMLVIGLLFAMAYKDCLETKNPFARLMVFYFALLVFFIPCNNQLFQSALILFSFYTTSLLWLITRGTLKKEWISKCVTGVKSLGRKQK